MPELTESAFGYELRTDDGATLEITDLSISSNVALEMSAEDAADLLNDVAGDVDDELLADTLQFLVEEHADEEQWFEGEPASVPEDERTSFGELMVWADERGLDVR